MKRAGYWLLAACLLLATSGCAPQSKEPEDGDRLRVVATIFPPYDFARQITVGLADITMLLPPGAESHSFEPTPQDMAAIQAADVFICIGGPSEAWVRRILESMDAGPGRVVSLLELVETVEEERVEGMQEEEGHAGEEDPELDEHVWTSPANARIIAAALADVLCQADPANAQAYRDNAAAYDAQLAALDADYAQAVAQGRRKTLVFGDRFPFRYLADAYGLAYRAAFPGCAAQAEPSAATVAYLIDTVKREGIPVVFHIEFSDQKMADLICEATGAKALLLHSCHNVSRDEFEAGATYLSLMRQNLEQIREALG